MRVAQQSIGLGRTHRLRLRRRRNDHDDLAARLVVGAGFGERFEIAGQDFFMELGELAAQSRLAAFAEPVREIGGLVLDPSHLAAKARWLKRHLAAERPVARFHQPVSFMVERLTGISVIDHALASTSMGYGLDRKDYDPALLDRFAKAGQIEVEDTTVAADLFLSLVIGRQTRMAMLGIETAPEQIDQRVQAAVRLFLDGVRPRRRG